MATLDALISQGVAPRSAAAILNTQLEDATIVLGATSIGQRNDEQVAFELYRQDLRQSIYLLNRRYPHLKREAAVAQTHGQHTPSSTDLSATANGIMSSHTSSSDGTQALRTDVTGPVVLSDEADPDQHRAATHQFPAATRTGHSAKRKRSTEDQEPTDNLEAERPSQRVRQDADIFLNPAPPRSINSAHLENDMADLNEYEGPGSGEGLFVTPDVSVQGPEDNSLPDIESLNAQHTHRVSSVAYQEPHEEEARHDSPQHAPVCVKQEKATHDNAWYLSTRVKEEETSNNIFAIPPAEVPGKCNYNSCVACDTICIDVETAEGTCKHDYCPECLENMFRLSTTDETMFPPRCCHGPIPLDSARPHLSTETATAFERKTKEMATPDKTYCRVSTCSAWIEPENIKDGKATCAKCGKRTCATCKGKGHRGACPEDEGVKQVLDLAKAKKWQRCSKCHNMVERGYGCNHMK